MVGEEDRISDLPDAISHYILSLLPCTKQAIKTSLLSKRWRNHWTRVPVLIFDSTGMSDEKFLQFIDNTLVLHECSKITKFHLLFDYHNKKDPDFAAKICFAARKYVEEINVRSSAEDLLPELLFDCDSLVKLRSYRCTFMPNRKVNWGCLTDLNITYCKLSYQAMQHILSGSPSLKSLEMLFSVPEKIVITSKSLKRLFVHSNLVNILALEISCPNIEELHLGGIAMYNRRLFAQAIENVLFGSLFLKSFELISCFMRDQLVIASKSLKKLVLAEAYNGVYDIEISCPQLEELKLLGCSNFKTTKFLNLPSSLCATIDSYNNRDQKTCKHLITEILQQLRHLNELKIGISFIEILSTIKVRGWIPPVLNIKCLTLNSPYLVKHHYGIAELLRISPMLQTLVINFPTYITGSDSKSGNNYWDSNVDVFDCMVSHLKIIKIVGYGFLVKDARCQHLLNLVEFLLKNARVLEKMMVVMKDDGRRFLREVSKKLLRLPKCSKNAIIEIVCSNKEIEKAFVGGLNAFLNS